MRPNRRSIDGHRQPRCHIRDGWIRSSSRPPWRTEGRATRPTIRPDDLPAADSDRARYTISGAPRIRCQKGRRRALLQRWRAGRRSARRRAARPDPKRAFAQLINAKPTEISYVPNTSTGENLVVEALGIKKFDRNVVTDELHFEGALIHLMELKKQGLDLRVVKPRDGRIDIKDMERVATQDKADRGSHYVHVRAAFTRPESRMRPRTRMGRNWRGHHSGRARCRLTRATGLDSRRARPTSGSWATSPPSSSYEGYSASDSATTGLRVCACRTIHMSPFDRNTHAQTWTPGTGATTCFSSAHGQQRGRRAPPFRPLQQIGVGSIQRYRRPILKRLQRGCRASASAADAARHTSPIHVRTRTRRPSIVAAGRAREHCVADYWSPHRAVDRTTGDERWLLSGAAQRRWRSGPCLDPPLRRLRSCAAILACRLTPPNARPSATPSERLSASTPLSSPSSMHA